MAKAWRAVRAGMVGAALTAAALAAAPGTGQAIGLKPSLVWFDPQTGFAIAGYDPVAYYVRHAARRGTHDIKLTVDGVTWQFESEANRAVFERDPEVYTPKFGGRDPMRLAEGYEALGNPNHWLIEGDELYLFSSADTRAEWLKATPRQRAAAKANWPDVVNATQ